MLLAQSLPVTAAPEELLGFAYGSRITRTERLFQFVRDDMVNYRCCCHPSLLLTHHTEWMGAKEDKALSIPFAAVDTRLFIHASLHALRRSVRGAASG